MNKFIVALLLTIPCAAAYAQAPDSIAADTAATDPYAQFYGMHPNNVYNDGIRFYNKQEYAQALPYLQYAADQGVDRAQYYTGWIFAHGGTGAIDNEQAIKYLTMASDQNFGLAQFDLGFLYQTLQDYANAIKYYELAVENGGFKEAMNNIGICYDLGLGVDCDEEKALHWYTRAAQKGHMEAMFNVGTFHELGKAGLPVDKEKALEWYAKAWSMGYYKAKEGIDRLTSK